MGVMHSHSLGNFSEFQWPFFTLESGYYKMGRGVSAQLHHVNLEGDIITLFRVQE